jgi:peptide/nickel transport system ATP-binding protein
MQYQDRKKIFSARDVVVKFNLRGKVLTAVRKASLDLYEGETLAIVGESGSGKSVFTKSFIGMLDKNGYMESGSLALDGQEYPGTQSEKEWLNIRGKKIAMVFQDPMTSLNPVKTVGQQIREVITWHFKTDKETAKQEAIELLRLVGIPEPEQRYKQYPHQFSGGMRQRVVIATAIACKPRILICDEPTTALDVTVQAQILQLIKELKDEFGMSVIYITHDLGVVAHVADRVAVMYAGQIIEHGLANEIFKDARHPYTKALLLSLPQLGEKGRDLHAIRGSPPNLYKEIKGDAFAPRNPEAMKIDFLYEPPMFQVSDTHFAKTWLLHAQARPYTDALDREGIKGTEPLRSSRPAEGKEPPLLSVKNLTVNYKLGRRTFCAVNDVSFDIHAGETFSLVGESGSGKTTVGKAIMKICHTNAGEIWFQGKQVNKKLARNELAAYRQAVQMIFQDPMASLNDRAKVEYIISEGLYNFKLFKKDAERRQKVSRAMESVGLMPEYLTRFPHEFSGGQRQRIGIARSLVVEPSLVVADEPISALDVSIRAQVINLLNRFKAEKQLTYLFIAHDLSVVRYISDRIAVMYKGRLVELAEAEALFRRPLHPYTRALMDAAPVPDPEIERDKKVAVYNPAAHDYTREGPAWLEAEPGHFVRANRAELADWLKITHGRGAGV